MTKAVSDHWSSQLRTKRNYIATGLHLTADAGLFGLPTVHLDMDFNDILKDLDFAAMAIAEARYDRYSLFTDILYTKISSGRGTPRGIIAGSVDVSSETFAGLIGAGAGYSVLQNERGNLDVVGGLRVWHASTDISFSGGLLDGRGDGATWVDDLAGLRGKYSITDKVYLTGWNLVGIGYSFNDKISAVAGYRALGVDYSDDGFVLDIVQQGPICGVVMHF